MSDKSSSSSGIGVVGLLGVAFVVLKLTGYIDSSWWWVTLTFWGGLVLLAIVGLVFFLLWLWNRRKPKKYEPPSASKISRWRERLEQLQKEQQQTRAQR